MMDLEWPWILAVGLLGWQVPGVEAARKIVAVGAMPVRHRVGTAVQMAKCQRGTLPKFLAQDHTGETMAAHRMSHQLQLALLVWQAQRERE